jgi:DNA-binding XRE family transcriptional regulator
MVISMTDDEDKKGNRVQVLREERLLSKAELARRAGVSVLTIDRVERGAACRLDTKRKIILALGKKLEEREDVFPELAAPKRRRTSED